MKCISWNVNGIRACINKGFIEYLENESPDIIGLQETKGRQEQVAQKHIDEIESLGYHIYWNAAERPGYSGTAVFSKKAALKVNYGFDVDSLDISDLQEANETIIDNHEGRVTTLEFEDFIFTTVYTPNSKDDLSRLDYRHKSWDKIYLQHIKKLEENKPVISCGDFNVAHNEIDLARPKQNTKSAWFTNEEREWMTNFLNAGIVDTFRTLYPEMTDQYSWWSYRWWARDRNVGWRIDYFLISDSLKSNLQDAFIRSQVLWSDHCPVGIEIKL